MNGKFSDFEFVNEGNNVSVIPVKRNTFEWEDLTNSIMDELAIEGLHFATN